jgi:hypothetical protein
MDRRKSTMSFGFARRPSAHQRNAARAAAAKRRIHELSNLKISEVSNVDVGAGEGCNVRLVKSWDGVGQTGNRGFTYRSEPMSLRETIAKSFQLRAQGQLSDFDLGVIHNKRATELGMTIGQYYDTTEGRAARDSAILAKNFSDQVSSACGDAYPHARTQFAKEQSGEIEEPFSRSAHTSPKIHHDQPSGIDGDSDDPDSELEKLGQAWIRAHPNHPMTKEQAIMHISLNTPEGRKLFAASKARSLRKNAG